MAKGQISMEYLMIFGFLMLMLLPLIGLYYSYANSSSDEIANRQIDQVIKKIGDNAETVYYLGYPSQTTIKAYIPRQVINISFNGREIIYYIKDGGKETSASYITVVNITGSLPSNPGLYNIEIKSLGNIVEVSYE